VTRRGPSKASFRAVPMLPMDIYRKNTIYIALARMQSEGVC
jgi:hypothetical protein